MNRHLILYMRCLQWVLIFLDHCNLINQFKGRKILDPDKSGKKAIDVAAKNGWEVYPTWTYKFMGEAIQNFGKLYVLNDIINNSISDPLEIEIKKNLI